MRVNYYFITLQYAALSAIASIAAFVGAVLLFEVCLDRQTIVMPRKYSATKSSGEYASSLT